MKILKATAAFTLMGLLAACGSTSKPTALADVSNYSGTFAEHRSYALNMMEAAELGGAKDVKIKDSDSVIGLAGSNASFGFVDSLASGGSLLTAGLSGLAGGLLTPDSDAQYNQVIALIDTSKLEPDSDVNAYARQEMLNKFSEFFSSAIGADASSSKNALYSEFLNKNSTSAHGEYASVWTDKQTSKKCDELSKSGYEEALAYGIDVSLEKLEEYENEYFDGNCGIRFSSIQVKDIVSAEKLPWLEKGRKYVVVTAVFGSSNVSLNYLSSQEIPVDGLYLYYTTNGANVGKLKDTAYPYIQAPHGKEMYFIKP